MPEQRIKDADGNEYYSPDGNSFQPIERIKDADGNEFENLGGTWKPVQTQPDILSMPESDEVDPLTLRGRQKVQHIETSKALLGGDEQSRLRQDYFKVPTAPPVEPVEPMRPSADYAKDMIQGQGVKPYNQMTLDERLSEQGLKPTGNRNADLKRLEKAERKNAKMATLATRTMLPAGPGYIPVVSEEAGLSVGQGVLNLARLPLSMMELAGALERRVNRAVGISDEVTDRSIVNRMAKGAEAMAGKIRGAERSAAALQMPTAPESVVDPDTGERVGIGMATRVLDPWKVIQTTGAEAAPMALNLATGGTASIPVAMARSIQGEMDDVADFYSERYGVDRQDAIAANVYSVTGSGAAQGTVAGLFDMFQVGEMLKVPGTTLPGKALRAFAIGASEGPSEYTENLISGGVKRATYNPELTWKQIENQAREGAILGMFSSGIFGAGSQVRGGGVEAAAPEQIPVEPAAPVMEEPAAPEDPVTATRKWIAELRSEVADLNQQIMETPVKYKKGQKADTFTAEQLAEMGRLQDEARRKQELADSLTGQLAEMQGAVPGGQQSEQIRNEIRRLEIEANEIMGRVGSMREGTKREAAVVRVQENAPARLRNAQIAMLEGVLDGSVNQDQLGFIAAPLMSVSPEIAADLAELSAAVKMAGITDFDRELGYLDAEANLAALNGQPVDRLFEKRINEELRPKIAEAIKDISPEFSVDGVKYVAPRGDIASRLKEAKRIHDEKQAKIRSQKNKSKAAKAAEHAKAGEEYAEAKRRVAEEVKADKAQKEESVLEELAANDPAFGEVKQSISNLLFDSGYTPEEIETIADLNSRIVYNLARREGLDPVKLLDGYGLTVSRYGFTEEGIPSAMNVTYTQPEYDMQFGSKQWNERFFGKYGKNKRKVSDAAKRARRSYKLAESKKGQQAFDDMRAEEARIEQEDFAAFNRELAGILPSRGFIQIGKDRKVHIGLLEDMDLSTFFHEFGGHFTLEMMGELASSPNASPGLKADYAQALKFLGVKDRSQVGRDQHEKFARAFEAYLMEGKAPTSDLQTVMERVKGWMVAIYRQITNLGIELNPEIRGVFDRLVAPSQQKTFLQENRNANARPESRVSAQSGASQFGAGEQAIGDAFSNWRSQNSGIASPEVQRLAGVISQFYPRLETGIMSAIENGADVRIGQDQDGNEVITAGWEGAFGREHLFQITMTPNTPIYIDATISDTVDGGQSFYIRHIEAARRGNRVSPIAYRNIAQTMQATRPEIETVSGTIVSKGSFLARTPYLSSNFNVVNGTLETDVRDLAEMNMVPGWDRAIGEKAWAAYEAGNTFLASDLLQSARGENGIVFFQSGLNPFAVVDSALGSAGLPTMRERLGINWETATAKDYWDALVRAIGGLGSSVRETSVKIRNKWKDLPEKIVRKIAEFAHTFTTTGKTETEKAADLKQTLNTYSRAMRAVSPDDLVIEGISNQDAGQIIKTMNDGKFRNELWKFSPVRKASMPSQFALRNMERMAPLDRAIQNKVGDRNSFKRIFESEAKLVTDIEANPEQDKYLGIALALASLPRQDGRIRPWTKDELKQRFPKMHDKTIDAYFKVRDAMRKANNLRVGALTEMTNKLIAKAERTMRKPDTKREVAISLSRNIDKLKAELAKVKSIFKNPEYWPLSRQGKYRWDMYASGVKEPIGTFFTEHAGDRGRREAGQQAVLMASLFPEVKKAVDAGNIEWNRDEPLGRPVQLPKVPDSVKNSGGLIMDLSTAAWATTASRISGEIGLDQDLGMLLTLGVNQSYMDQYAKAHEMKREGVPGWSPEAGNIFRMTINSWANEFANNRNRSDIENAILRLTQKEAGRLYDPALLEEAQAQARWESAPPYSKASNAIATYAFIHSLGGVPIFAVMNGVFQPMTNSIPYFSNIYGSVEATKATAIAQAVATQFIQWTRLEDFEGMSAADISKMVNDRVGNLLNQRLIGWFAGDEKTAGEIKRHVIAALTNAMTSGVTSPNVAMELTTKSKEFGSSQMLSGRVSPEAAAVINKFFKGGASIRDFFMDVWGSMAYKTERINLTRDVIAAAILGAKHGYLNTHDGGTSLEKITEGSEVDPDREWASDIGYRSALATRNTNLAGGRGNVPGYMRIPGMVKPWLTPMLLYKRFMVNTAVTFHTLGVADARNHQIEQGQAPTGKLRVAGMQGVKYAKGHLGNAMSTMLLAGPAAYWPIAIAAAVAKAALGDDEWWKFWEQVNADAVEKGMAIVPGETEDEKRKRAMDLLWNVERGAVNLSGVDAHDSLAAGLFLGKSDSVAEFIGNALLGPLGQPIGGSIDHVMRTKSVAGLGEKVMPRQLKNMDRAQTGNMNFLGGTGPDYTPVERFAKTLSMKPTRESKLQYYQTKKFEVMQVRKDKVAYFTEKMKRMLREIGGTQSAGFSDAIKSVQSEMNEWNKDKAYWMQRFPGQFRPITIDDIDYLFRPKGMDLDKAKSEMGID